MTSNFILPPFLQEEVYELLCILDFNNVRKRMSVILRREGKIRLYCKGSSSLNFNRLSVCQSTRSTNREHDVLNLLLAVVLYLGIVRRFPLEKMYKFGRARVEN